MKSLYLSRVISLMLACVMVYCQPAMGGGRKLLTVAPKTTAKTTPKELQERLIAAVTAGRLNGKNNIDTLLKEKQVFTALLSDKLGATQNLEETPLGRAIMLSHRKDLSSAITICQKIFNHLLEKIPIAADYYFMMLHTLIELRLEGASKNDIYLRYYNLCKSRIEQNQKAKALLLNSTVDATITALTKNFDQLKTYLQQLYKKSPIDAQDRYAQKIFELICQKVISQLIKKSNTNNSLKQKLQEFTQIDIVAQFLAADEQQKLKQQVDAALVETTPVVDTLTETPEQAHAADKPAVSQSTALILHPTHAKDLDEERRREAAEAQSYKLLRENILHPSITPRVVIPATVMEEVSGTAKTPPATTTKTEPSNKHQEINSLAKSFQNLADTLKCMAEALQAIASTADAA